MSAILDALKKVEERLRAATQQETTEGLMSELDAATMLGETPKPPIAQEKDESEIMTAYLGLLQMIVLIQNHARELIDKERTGTRDTIESLNREVASLRSRLAQVTETQEKQAREHERDLAIRNRAFAEARAQIKNLKQRLETSNAAIVEARSRIVRLFDVSADLAGHVDVQQESSMNGR